MSTTCISGAGRAYRFESLDLEMIKSPSSTSWISNSSSPSSTLSESSNCPNSVSTRKPRTPRKRPNQTYNEAAAILSTAYPKLFPTKHLTKPCTKLSTKNQFLFDPSPDDESAFLLFHPQRPNFSINLFEKAVACHSPGEINSSTSLHTGISYDCNRGDDFDAESILNPVEQQQQQQQQLVLWLSCGLLRVRFWAWNEESISKRRSRGLVAAPLRKCGRHNHTEARQNPSRREQLNSCNSTACQIPSRRRIRPSPTETQLRQRSQRLVG